LMLTPTTHRQLDIHKSDPPKRAMIMASRIVS